MYYLLNGYKYVNTGNITSDFTRLRTTPETKCTPSQTIQNVLFFVVTPPTTCSPPALIVFGKLTARRFWQQK